MAIARADRWVKASERLHRWLEIQGAGGFGQSPIQGGKTGAPLTAQQVQSIGEVETLAMPGQRLTHQLFLLQMHVADRHQALKGSDDRAAIEAIGATQHPLKFQHHRDRHKAGRAGIDASPYSDAVAGLLPVVDAHAPWLLQLEFTNVLRTACRRGTLPVAAAREIVDQVALLPIRIDAAPPQPAALLSLALRFQLSSYDAAYLELALRLQLPIASRDHALADAAWAAGVGVLTT